MFADNLDPRKAAKNEGTRWNNLVQSPQIGFTEKYAHNRRLKKNIHSIKAFTETAAEEAVDKHYADAYGDHDIYLKDYVRWSEEKKIAKFRAMEPLLALYSVIENVTNDPELVKENNMMGSKLDSHDLILTRLSEKTKNETSLIPDAKLKSLIEEVLRETKVI